MAAAKTSSTNRWNLKGIIPLIFCGSFLLSVSIVNASAAPAKRAYSCGSLRSMARIYMASGGYEKAQPFLVKALHMAKETIPHDGSNPPMP